MYPGWEMKSTRVVDNTASHNAEAELNLLHLEDGHKRLHMTDCIIKTCSKVLQLLVQLTNSCFRETHLACLIIAVKQEHAIPVN